MEFAQQGPAALARELAVPVDPEFDSPFEEEVCHALEEQGLTLHRQIGCAGYRIDLAVVDNDHPGRYLVGVECDGATYHSSKTARDRDRLRQQVLEEMGWRGRILRIWSSDWIQNCEAQVARVLQFLETVRDIVEDDFVVGEPDDESCVMEPKAGGSDGEIVIDAEHNLLTSSNDTEPDDTLPEGVMIYQAFIGESLGTPAEFYNLAEYYPGRIADVLRRVVEQEGPIHILEATRRVVACWGMGKAGANLVKAIKVAATRAQKNGTIAIRGDFLWLAEVPQALVRVPSNEQPVRNIEYVPLEEIAEACILCIRDAYAIPQEELVTQAARLLGYLRTGGNVRGRVAEAIAYASQQGKVEIKEGSVTLL